MFRILEEDLMHLPVWQILADVFFSTVSQHWHTESFCSFNRANARRLIRGLESRHGKRDLSWGTSDDLPDSTPLSRQIRSVWRPCQDDVMWWLRCSLLICSERRVSFRNQCRSLLEQTCSQAVYFGTPSRSSIHETRGEGVVVRWDAIMRCDATGWCERPDLLVWINPNCQISRHVWRPDAGCGWCGGHSKRRSQ